MVVTVEEEGLHFTIINISYKPSTLHYHPLVLDEI
jgi:hypothetical protein